MGERDKKNKLIYKTDKKFHAKQMLGKLKKNCKL